MFANLYWGSRLIFFKYTSGLKMSIHPQRKASVVQSHHHTFIQLIGLINQSATPPSKEKQFLKKKSR